MSGMTKDDAKKIVTLAVQFASTKWEENLEFLNRYAETAKGKRLAELRKNAAILTLRIDRTGEAFRLLMELLKTKEAA